MQESFGAYIPFVEHLGFEMEFFEDGQSELRYLPEESHLNSFNVTHGGALMTLLDVTMATAARSVDRSMGVITIEMKTSFMQPARGQLVAKGKLLHRSKTMAWRSQKAPCLMRKAMPVHTQQEPLNMSPVRCNPTNLTTKFQPINHDSNGDNYA